MGKSAYSTTLDRDSTTPSLYPPIPSASNCLPASPAGSGPDTVTVFTAIDSSGRARDITVEGWYQLFDSDENGLLLISNTWTLGQNWAYPGTWGVFPAVYLVDGNALLRIIDERSPG